MIIYINFFLLNYTSNWLVKNLGTPCTTIDAFGKDRSDFSSPVDLCAHEICRTNFVNDF